MSLVVNSGQTVSLTSTTSGAVVFSGGTLDVLTGGMANAAQIDGLMQVSSGGAASGATISNTGEVIVSSGATASGTVIDGTGYPGPTLLVAAGGSAVGTVVINGEELVFGTASGTVVSGVNASQTVASGGLAIGATLGNSSRGGDEQIVSRGGSARGTVVSGGADVIVSGGTATSLDLLASGTTGGVYLYLFGGSAGLVSGDTANGDVVIFSGTPATLGISGTTMPVATISGFDSAGPAASDTIDLQSVAPVAGGSAVLGSGNVLSVTEGGGTYTLDFTASQTFGGEAFQLAADGSGGTDVTLGYSGFVVTSGQSAALTSALSGATVFAGGTLDVSAGGALSAALIEGNVRVSAGGSAAGATLNGTGNLTVASGGTASGTVIDGNRFASPGATQTVAAGGTAIGTVISNGTEIVSGTASDTVVTGGELASQTVASGGLAIATSVGGSPESDPYQIVSAGGSARDTVLSANGNELIAGGTATGLDLLGSDSLGFTAYLYIDSGGSAGLAAGDAAAGDVIVFSGTSAALGISGTTMPIATISGFDSAGPAVADTIDLQSVAFATGGSAVVGSGNVLSVTEGGSTYTLNFASGQSFDGESFRLAADGGTGTDITLAYSGFVVTGGQTAAITSAVSGATVFPGGTLDVGAGGTATSATVEGLLQVSAGGSAGATSLIGSGTVIVSSGGLVNGTRIDGESFAVSQVIEAGGSADGTVVVNGTELVSGTASGTLVSGLIASQTVMSGGLASGATVVGGSQSVSAGGSAAGTVVSAGGAEVIHGGTATALDLLTSTSFGDVAYLFLSGGSAGLAAGDLAAGDVILFSATSATLGISGTTMPTATISGFDAAGPATGDTIDLHSIAFGAGAAVSLGSGNVLSVTEGGSTYTLNLDPAQSFAGETFRLAADGAGGTDITAPPCYAAGTLIATPAGPVPVEALRAGDAVLARTDGDWAPHRVRWAGRLRVDLTRHPRPDRAAPVRIRADAFAPGVPRRDLLLSPDHAVFLDGALIQAQALVNGATIVRDDPACVTYVHVELDRHGLLLAEGLAAESYLDTGNRALFAGEAGARALHPDLSGAAAWDALACAPLLLGGARVAAAHAALRARAEALGFARSDDAALMVLAGLRALPRDAAGRFLVPAGTRELRLRSRIFVPSWFGAMDDRRLGVAVRAVRLDGRALPARAFGAGWHAREPHWRWTDGDAVLHLPPLAGTAPHRLRVACAAAGRYWLGGGAVPAAPSAVSRR